VPSKFSDTAYLSAISGCQLPNYCTGRPTTALSYMIAPRIQDGRCARANRILPSADGDGIRSLTRRTGFPGAGMSRWRGGDLRTRRSGSQIRQVICVQPCHAAGTRKPTLSLPWPRRHGRISISLAPTNR
jgi:hypothetical protein